MNIDETGEALIKGFEGFSKTMYLDKAGVPTIGFGHTKGVTLYTLPITEEQAELFFQEDLAPAEQAVNQWVRVPITQNEFNALVSFTFNVGVEAFETSDLLKDLNKNNMRGVRYEFALWNHIHIDGKAVICEDLVKRRAAESNLFFTPESQ
jgi:lysozyme